MDTASFTKQLIHSYLISPFREQLRHGSAFPVTDGHISPLPEYYYVPTTPSQYTNQFPY
jgi:hypothetical protein